MISRSLINKNIKFHDVTLQNNSVHIDSFSYNDLEKLIDRYKNILLSKGAKTGYSAVIGLPVSIKQTALVFACAELGITVTIVDYPHGKNFKPNTYVPGSIDTKLSLMLPITFLLSTNNKYTLNNDKTRILMDVCNSTLLLDEIESDNSKNEIILSKPDTTFLKCTSSGTTTTPKVITHTHEFMSQLIVRNSKMFNGKMAMIANLNHGSSPATFFLPGVVSTEVTDFYHICPSTDVGHFALISQHLSNLGIHLNHVMFPYSHLIENFFSSETKLQDCTFYTLSIIKKEWIKFVNNKIKDIISIFGTNETSGSLMINQASDVDFKENTYKLLDNFYKINITEKNELQVTMPIYKKTILTGDRFRYSENKLEHLGRSNLYRVNDLEINIDYINKFIQTNCNGEILVDLIKDSLYLILWEDVDYNAIKIIDKKLREMSGDLHYISKFAALKQENFMTGVKVDRQLLREYFRNMVNQNTLH